MKVILNLIGILLYFLMRFNGRTNKVKEPDIKFWIKDNGVELLIITLFDVSLMLLLLKGGVVVDLNKYFPSLPDGLAFAGDLAICWLIGLMIAAGIYELIKTKQKK